MCKWFPDVDKCVEPHRVNHNKIVQFINVHLNK